MFKVFGLTKGNCDGDESHADREVMLVEDTLSGRALHLCPKCFLSQLRFRSKGKRVEPAAADDGQPHAAAT